MFRVLSQSKLKIFFPFLLVLCMAVYLPAVKVKDQADSTTQGTSCISTNAHTAAEAPQGDEKLDEKLKKFRSFLITKMKKWQVPGMGVGIVKDNKVVLAEGFGVRNREKNLPVTPNTLFAIGSASKAFTTLAVGILVDEGKVEWNKPVRDYLPEFKLKDEIATERMTVRDLVCHRSGLPRHDALWYGSSITRKQIVKRLKYLDFSADIRSTFQYNNLMYVTAGYLIERVTGSTWEEFVSKRIFEPLGMTNSNFSVEDSKKSDHHSLPYIKKDDKVMEIPFRKIDSVGPAGSINSCVNDILKWVNFHLNKGKVAEKQIISEAGHKEMYTPSMFLRESMLSVQPDGQSDMNYGLGWFLETYRGHKLVHHGGAIDGFYFLNAFLPNHNLGAVVLTNLSGTPLVQISMGYILDMMLDLDQGWEKISKERYEKAEKDREKAEEEKKKKEEDRVEGTTPSHSLESYEGEYEHPAYGIIPITVKENSLTGKFNSFPFTLEHWHYDVFKVAEEESKISPIENLQVTFHTNSKGDINRLSVPLEPSVSAIVFTKKAPQEMKDPEFLSQFTGEYEVMEMKVTISLKGDTLFATIPSQPTMELVPYKGTEFTLKGLEGYSIEFVIEQSRVTEIKVSQPGGTFRGKKIN
ncbi:MAG: serine hydrolase [Candidatus Aminicenantes bacterium]